jgi:hypothetical protein
MTGNMARVASGSCPEKLVERDNKQIGGLDIRTSVKYI